MIIMHSIIAIVVLAMLFATFCLAVGHWDI